MRLATTLSLVVICAVMLTGCVNKKDKTAAENNGEQSSALPADATVFDELAANMVLVEGGSFTMGVRSDKDKEVEVGEATPHSVTLSDFHLCKYEVTQKLWTAVMGENPSEFQGDDLPVENVSWGDCYDFISKLNELTGKNYRLPTEAEWEYACRGGKHSKGYYYSGSDDPDKVAWTEENSGEKTHPVGQKQPNELGLYDMNGNVWEWCNDFYDYYENCPQTNPVGPSEGMLRVSRGGSWIHNTSYCQPTLRNSAKAGFCINCNGLRLAQ